MANGHPRAREYPLGMLWDEARIVVNRQTAESAHRALLYRAAISATRSEEGAKAFDKMIMELLDG